MTKAQSYLVEGYTWVVDMDLGNCKMYAYYSPFLVKFDWFIFFYRYSVLTVKLEMKQPSRIEYYRYYRINLIGLRDWKKEL